MEEDWLAKPINWEATCDEEWSDQQDYKSKI